MRGIVPLRITGIQVTESFISVVISSNNGIVAACTVSQPVKPYRHYKLETFVDNIVGVVVFGHGACTEFGSWQFTENNVLDPTAVVSLPGFPVLSLGKNTKLSGDITLEAGSDLILEKVDVPLGHTLADGYELQDNTIDGTGYKISLSVNAPLRSTTVTNQQELLKEYAGPCSMRLSNKDCPYITSINGVSPDINGNINIKTSTSNPELKTITVTETGTYLYSKEDSCKDDPKESVFVLIGDRQELDNPYMGGTFRRCGQDYCEITDSDNHQEDFANAAVVNDGKTNGVRVNRSTGLLEPMEGVQGKAAVKFTTHPCTSIEAVFPYRYYISAGEPVVAIIYNIKDDAGLETYEEFRFTKDTLTLGDKTAQASIPYGSTIKLVLLYTKGTFTGKLDIVDQDKLENKLTLTSIGENEGGTGIYIEHCRCQSWKAI